LPAGIGGGLDGAVRNLGMEIECGFLQVHYRQYRPARVADEQASQQWIYRLSKADEFGGALGTEPALRAAISPHDVVDDCIHQSDDMAARMYIASEVGAPTADWQLPNQLGVCPALGQRQVGVDVDAEVAEVMVDDQPSVEGKPVDQSLARFGPPAQPGPNGSVDKPS
jgi:hypothetical protein